MASQETVDTKKIDPSSTYSVPSDVLNDKTLSKDAKIQILREWYYDAVRLQEASAENMTGGEPDRLQSVSDALLKLGVSPVKEQDVNAQPEPSILRKFINSVTRPSNPTNE